MAMQGFIVNPPKFTSNDVFKKLKTAGEGFCTEDQAERYKALLCLEHADALLAALGES